MLIGSNQFTIPSRRNYYHHIYVQRQQLRVAHFTTLRCRAGVVHESMCVCCDVYVVSVCIMYSLCRTELSFSPFPSLATSAPHAPGPLWAPSAAAGRSWEANPSRQRLMSRFPLLRYPSPHLCRWDKEAFLTFSQITARIPIISVS